MASLAGHLQDQTIREAQSWTFAEMLERGSHDIRILDDEITMVEQDFDGGRDLNRTMTINRAENPQGLDEDEVRDPCAFGYERLGGSDLPGIVPDCQPDQDIGVNGAHSAS